VQISSEELVAQNPDVILLADALYGVTVESVAERAGWSEIKAVGEGNVYPFDPFILSVPGPRLVDGFERIVDILYPDIAE
jgi:iron complex transport system substrate-binding protein